MHKYGADVSRRQYIALTAASAIGTVLEWYDYSVWTQLSPFLAKAFFPASESVALRQLNFWLVYAVGFLFRPLGSLFFGHLCDVVGRRVSLLATLIMMGTSTVLIGCLPTYAHIGIAAPVLLAVLRLLQGLAVGGELGTAVVFMHELAPPTAKTKGGCIVFMSVNAGIVFGILVAMIVNAAVPPEYMLLWGWRIPFLLAVFTATAGVVLRQHWREVLLMFWFETWSAANFYVFYGWLPSFLNTSLGFPLKLTLGMTLTNMSLTLSMIPIFAHLSDRGVPRMAATACIMAVAAASSVPMFLAISTNSLAAAWLMQLADLTLNASIFGFIPTIGNNLFPVHVRATGFNFVHTASQSWLGGLSPLIITALQLATGNTFFTTGIYLTVAAVISLCACAGLWRWYPATNRTPPEMQQAAEGLLPAASLQ
ncbi:hypothetical protein OEZ85_004984 [Tetradesmus obliquus]|uniref:Major facilitator superfamily (MFS) profile domain-containing protein n=1 Tax=Tetradesmus obliquus TaxID=3088 RepID=A0ABY8UHJ6_TETOB|nr:hypothetical protein OEZ85_004984 [Tetradesmus obliquus]